MEGVGSQVGRLNSVPTTRTGPWIGFPVPPTQWVGEETAPTHHNTLLIYIRSRTCALSLHIRTHSIYRNGPS